MAVELEFFIDKAQCVAAITQPEFADMVAEAGGGLKWSVVIGQDFEDLFADDAEAYETIVRALHGVVPHTSRAFRRHTKWVERQNLADALRHLSAPPEAVAAVEAALAELSERRTSGPVTPASTATVVV